MARTHSSYTASPTRWRSPQRSPARPTSEDGSQYEMDLDVLGLNSTFESTEIDEKHQPKVDVVDTSDIEGPDDFTMNMTYWMTADLPLAQQIKSRKEANIKIAEVRGDVIHESEETQDTAGEGDRALIEESSRDRVADADLNSASPTMRANGTEIGRSSSKAISEASMENEEKVRSYLSALPDTEIGEGAITSTPLHIPKQNMLQVPSPAAPKARSLQATVEDYDTPRKPTQETVIHHPTEATIDAEREEMRRRITELQSCLEQQESASRARVTELETLLSYTRSDLEASRTECYKQKERITSLQQNNERLKKDVEASRASVEVRLKTQEEELNAKMQEFGEELRLQNLARLQNQREDFERQLGQPEEAKRAVDQDMRERGQLLEQVKGELSQLRRSHEQELQDRQVSGPKVEHPATADFSQERVELQQRLSHLQSRADMLQSDLAKATAEAKSARQEAQANAELISNAEAVKRAQESRIANLEARNTSLQTHLNSAQADIAAKALRLQQSSDLESRLRSLQSQLDSSGDDVATRDKQQLHTQTLELRLKSLQSQLESARTEAHAKDQDILRLIHEHEQHEQRSSSAKGRTESLEATVSALRQQLAEAHRDSGKAQTDAERFEKDLEDAADRLRDVSAEANRRIADVEKKLNKMKELKLEAEAKLKELQSQHDDLVEDHEAKLDDVREKAEDAVRKAGSLLEQERAEKRRIMKELKKTSRELEELRTEVSQRAAEESSDEETSLISSHTDAKDAEIENLRTLLRKQSSTLKTLKVEMASLRKENTRLKVETSAETIANLQAELASLRRDHDRLLAEAETREADFEAVNKAMDERLAVTLSKMLKERARTVVSKRDGQWVETVGKANEEKEFMGKVLMREWGRQEVGVAAEGEKQGYRYKYVKRT